jgi:hypothetical protein
MRKVPLHLPDPDPKRPSWKRVRILPITGVSLDLFCQLIGAPYKYEFKQYENTMHDARNNTSVRIHRMQTQIQSKISILICTQILAIIELRLSKLKENL